MSNNPLFTDIANAIREKDGTTARIPANHFPGRIYAAITGQAEPAAKTYSGVEGLKTLLKDISNMIRSLDGTTATIPAPNLPARIRALQSQQSKYILTVEAYCDYAAGRNVWDIAIHIGNTVSDDSMIAHKQYRNQIEISDDFDLTAYGSGNYTVYASIDGTDGSFFGSNSITLNSPGTYKVIVYCNEEA